MRQHLRFLAAYASVIVVCLSALPSYAQNESFEAAEQVPVNVHSAMSGGFWTVGNDEGFFRAVVIVGGVEHVVHRFYIQWLRSDVNKQSYELVRTVNVKELNLGHGHVLAVKTEFGDINSFKIDIIANSRGGKAKRFAITAKGDGKYVIQSQ